MKKILFILLIYLTSITNLSAENEIKRIYEGKDDSKITILVFESLTCSHCAKFHLDVYPKLKEKFIDKGFVKLEYRNFPLDLAAFNAAKAAHCKISNGEEILHFLYKNQSEWVKGNTIEDLNTNLEKILKRHQTNKLHYDNREKGYDVYTIFTFRNWKNYTNKKNSK